MGVKIRYKNKKDNKQSIYLDITKDKKRKYEFFEDFFRYANPKTDEEKKFNKRIDAEIQKIAAQRSLDLLTEKVSFLKVDKADEDFLKHFKEEADKRFAKRGAKSNTYCCYKYICEFTGGKLLLKDLTEEFVQNFKAFLLQKVSANCARTYYWRFKMIIKIVLKKGLIKEDPSLDVPQIKEVTPYREYLTAEEVAILREAPCKNDLIKRMFLFSCFTGLRISDIKAIKWSNVKGNCLVFHPVKTPAKLQNTPLNKHAKLYMGQPKKAQEYVFPWPYGESNRYDLLKLWVLRSGINKEVTWHTGRHTCATLLLLTTGNLKVPQSMLGHSRSSTTEIYAHLLNVTLVEAVDSLDNI